MTGMPSAPQPSPAPLPEVGAADIVPVAATAPDPPRHEETIGDRDLRDWRSRTGRRLLRIFATLVIRGERIWRGWSLHLTVLAILLVGGALATAVAEAGADVYEDVQHQSGIAGLDQPVLDWAVANRTPTSSHWVTDFTHIGGTVGGPIVALAVVGALVWAWRKWTPVLVMVPGLVGALLITVVGKDVTGRARPPQALAVPPFEVSASFPSGHTLNATVLAGLAVYLLLIVTRRWWLGILGVVLAIGYAATMGLSRVWLGHHWLTDVVAGWLLGAAWVLGVITVHRLVLTVRHHAHPEAPA